MNAGEERVLEILLEDLERSPGFFYTRVCELVKERSRADLVWLGFVEDGSVKPRAYSGKHFAYLKNISIDLRDPRLSQGPTGRALLEGRPAVEPDIRVSPSYAPWRERALYFGFRSSMALPLIYRNETLGVLNLYSLKENYFDPNKVTALERLARELALVLALYARIQKLGRKQWSLERRVADLERHLREKDLYLQHVEESKDRWLALLGHELRTPLTSILGFTEMLLSGLFGKPSEKQERYLRHIKKNAEFILRILEELQKMARLKYSEGIGSEIFSFEEALEGALFLLREKISEREIFLKIDYPEGLNLRGESHLLQEVLFNLLSNALKFSPTKGTIFVKAVPEKDLKGRSWTGIEVIDEGPGVRPADYYRIFKPFVQAGAFYTEKPTGLGLGLSLSKEVVEKQGGALVVLPSKKGGHFVVFWPETRVTRTQEVEFLLLEGRTETAYRLVLWLAGEGLRATPIPEAGALLSTLKEERRTFILALDPWEYPREARRLFLLLEEEGRMLPTLFYRMEGGRLKLALGANFVCLRPLNFPFLMRLKELYLHLFEALPTRVFLNAREHLASEARRLLSALDLELVLHPEEAEVAALDLGLPPAVLTGLTSRIAPEKPLFINFSDINLRFPETDSEASVEDLHREISRLLLGSKTEVGGTGTLT